MVLSAIVKKKIYDVVKKYANPACTVIWEKQAEARPPKPYISLDIIAGPVMIGNPDEYVDDSDDKIVQTSTREFTVAMNYFGQDAFAELGRVQESFGLPTAGELMRQVDLVFVRDSGPRDLSSLMENRYESRSQMDCVFRTTNTVKDLDSTVIEVVELENGMDGSIAEVP